MLFGVIPLSLATLCHGDEWREILTNGDLDKTARVEKTVEKWSFPSGKLPVSWKPIYSYGDAEAEAVPVAADPTNFELRLKRGAIAQHLSVKPSPRERLLAISLELRGKGACLIRTNGRDRATIKDITEQTRRYQGQIVVPPGEAINRFSLWAYASDIRIDNVSARLTVPPAGGEVRVREETVPVDATTTRIRLKAGPAGVKLNLSFRDGTKREIAVHPFTLSYAVLEQGEDATTFARVLPEAGLGIAGLQGDLRLHVRPNVSLYRPEVQADYVAKWNSLPSARAHCLVLEFHRDGGRLTVYVDGQYAGRLQGSFATITASCPEGSALVDIVHDPTSRDKRFLPLTVDHLSASESDDVKITLVATGFPATVLGCFAGGSGRWLDIGKTARAQNRYGGFRAQNYLSRSGFDGDEESLLFTVPSEQYVRAWILCALDDSLGRDTALTARLTRFVSGSWGGRARECLADTTIELPRGEERPGPGLTRVGTVALKGRTTPLWLAEMPLRSGDIQDVILFERGDRQRGAATGPGAYGKRVTFENGAQQRGVLNFGPYLDFELTGRLIARAHPFGDSRYLPDPGKVSGVRVFGVTLEKTPVEMKVRQTQPGNIFHNDEKPEALVVLRPRRDGEYQLRWSIRGVDGEAAETRHRGLSLRVSEGEQQIRASLQQPQVGWYGVVFELSQAGRRLLAHQASFALLGPDTRQAGYESPYATWWFRGAHYGTPDPKIAGPLLLKAGLRRINPGGRVPTEAEMAPWKTTITSIGWPRALLDGNAPDAKIENHIRETLERYPHCRNVMIFHESIRESPYRNAPELFGLPPVKESEKAPKRREQALRMAKLVRAKFPQLKIVIGNSLASTELNAEQLRHGFPKDYADYIGIETVGRTTLPERISEFGQAGAWLLREIARKFDCPWGVTTSYECNYRQVRLLGATRQAEWYVRDLLLAHAYGFPDISLSLIYDHGNRYHSSFWGDVALCERYPLLYPRKSYVAVATLTKALDRAKLLREVPTGPNSVYALEFRRPDQEYVYALWAGRGTAELRLAFQADADYELVDLYGRSHRRATAGRRAELIAGTAAQYLVTSQPMRSIACGARTYPDDQPAPGFQRVVAMDNAEDWRLVLGKDPLLEMSTKPRLPFRTAGEFVMRAVSDPERGDCLEVELEPSRDLPTPLMSEYATLRLKEPVHLAGDPRTLGVWVKGNSGWGQVYFEVEDAKGTRRISCGTTVHNADVFDYDGRMSINFDGWCFLSFPVTRDSPIPDLSTGSVVNLWESSQTYQPDRQSPFTYPIKLIGIAFSLPPQAIHLSRMRPIRQVLRFKEIHACGSNETTR